MALPLDPRHISLAALVATIAMACEGPAGPRGLPGPDGAIGPTGQPGTPAITTGNIAGTVRDNRGTAIDAVSIQTVPGSATTTSGADGTFTLTGLPIGAYSVIATKARYATYTLPGVGVAAGLTTNVSLVLEVGSDTPGTVSGMVTDAARPTPTPLSGVLVRVEGSSLGVTTGPDGAFSLTDVPPGPVFLSATAPSAAYLDTETRNSVRVPAGGAITGVKLVLSARPSDSARYVGMDGGACETCHYNEINGHRSSAHYRSLTRISRDSAGVALADAWTRLLNPTLTSPRTVMIPLGGTVAVPAGNRVIGTGTLFRTGGANGALAAGDKLGYTPPGLGWTEIGVVQTVDSDTEVTLTARARFAPTVTALPASTPYGVERLSSTGHTHLWPEDSSDIVAPAWPGVRATNPNYDPNDPCIYGPLTDGTCAAGGTAQYTDGQVYVYLCNLEGSTVQGTTYVADEYVLKFGGLPWTCSDGTFWNGFTTPAVPLVHIDVLYGGQGDKDPNQSRHPNVGVFKQQYQGRLADIRAADAWVYTAGKELDSLTLPILLLESGDQVNGGHRLAAYHPTEQEFPGASWTQRTRTFSRACAGCHNTGLYLDWDSVTVTLPFERAGAAGPGPMSFAAVSSYGFGDENLTCEHCHGPASEHVPLGGAGNAIINPKYLTAEAERQMCGSCHAYAGGTSAQPAQGGEYPWNSDHAARIGGGAYVPGVHELPSFFGNWSELETDDVAFWDPAGTLGALYGQGHRQQYVLLGQSVHANNPHQKTTCTSCHDHHLGYLGSTDVQSPGGDRYRFYSADHRNNVLCLSCHAAHGPFAAVSKDDVANLHAGLAGGVTKNGLGVSPDGDELHASELAISETVAEHVFAQTSMIAFYDPLDDLSPVGRCTSCHMPKLGKSGGYVTGADPTASQALVEGDEASHSFEVVWPWQSNALSRSGPTFPSGSYAKFVSATGARYDMFGYLPNSCAKCHANARRASLVCPEPSSIWPPFWPLAAHRSDAYWSSCYSSASAP